jgi:hypothetical protein
MCFRTECPISGYRSCENGFVTKASILLHWTQNEDWECFQHFRYLRNVKRCKTCVSGLNAPFGVPKLQIWFRNQSIHSTPLDPNDYLECFGAFRKPKENKMMQNLCLGPECTIFWHQSYKDRLVTKASILLQWTQNHWECFGAFRKPSEWKKMQSTQNEDWAIFGAFCKPSECKKMQILCFEPKCTISRYPSCDASIKLY